MVEISIEARIIEQLNIAKGENGLPLAGLHTRLGLPVQAITTALVVMTENEVVYRDGDRFVLHPDFEM